MIVPTIGRVVWYRPSTYDLNVGMIQNDAAQAFDAHIVFVWSDTCVNLVVFDHDGNQFRRTSVSINQLGARPMAEWMPYQVGQAKKHEPASGSAADTGSTV